MTTKVQLELPKALIDELIEKRPVWLKQTSKAEFLSRVIAAGDFSPFFKQLEEANKVVDSTLGRLGFPATKPKKNKPQAGAPTPKVSAPTTSVP